MEKVWHQRSDLHLSLQDFLVEVDLQQPIRCQFLQMPSVAYHLFIVIRSLLSFVNVKQHKFFTIHLLKFEVDNRCRVQLCLYLFAYSLSIAFCISKSYHLIVITDAKHQCSAFAIGKGRYTF